MTLLALVVAVASVTIFSYAQTGLFRLDPEGPEDQSISYPKTRVHAARRRRARSSKRYEAASVKRAEIAPVTMCST